MLERIQKEVVRLLATNPAGHGLCLIGGFRFRFLDHSVRMSVDIDYHWEGDLGVKQEELVSLFGRKLLPLVKRQFDYSGRVDRAIGEEAESPAVRIIELAFWPAAMTGDKIEIPVEITRILCADEMAVRTADGVVYPTPSDADIIESKVLAIFNRTILQHRDIVDLYLFSNRLLQGSPQRIANKLATVDLARTRVADRLRDLEEHAAFHIRAIAAVLESQVEPETTANIRLGGGAESVYRAAFETIRTQTKPFLEQGS